MGLSTTTIIIVVQLGLAMMPRGRTRASSALHSGTTSGTSASMRNALELSIITAPYLDQVIFVHIPRTGERLLPEDVDAAAAAASDFYKQKFGVEKAVFACHSWLLYPENKNMLSPSSNLYSFMSRFDVIDVEEDTEYKEVWRLFDKDYDGNADDLPQDTSLRRAYAKRIKEGKPLGVALGVWVYKK